jgi:hypothetical protein
MHMDRLDFAAARQAIDRRRQDQRRHRQRPRSTVLCAPSTGAQ